jgi:hypothetical protein
MTNNHLSIFFNIAVAFCLSPSVETRTIKERFDIFCIDSADLPLERDMEDNIKEGFLKM